MNFRIHRSLIQMTAVTTWLSMIGLCSCAVLDQCGKRCSLGQACWPSSQVWIALSQTVAGEFLWPDNPNYAKLNTMKNARVKKKPAVIVFVTNADDVKKCVHFTRKFNIRVSIMSSGHSFIGRSTHDDSVLINLSRMEDIQVNTSPTSRSEGGEITVQTGNTWAKVYKELDKHGRIVVGGSAHTVGMGGYTQGGGHSPMSRSLGLAVDNLLEVNLVTAEGHLVTTSANGIVNHDTGVTSTDTDLFWALRGGGGGTWGIVISFTFKLHIPPSGFVQYTAVYPLYYNNVLLGDKSLQKVLGLMECLPKQWGGYVVMSTESEDPVAKGGYLLSLLHYGPWGSDSFSAIDELASDPNGFYKVFMNKTSFWDYEQNISDADVSMYRTYMVNSLIQPGKSGGNLASVIMEEMFTDTKYAASCGTFTMLGGTMQDVTSTETPVNPGFRSATFSLSMARVWDGTAVDCINIKHADRFNTRLQEFGDGVYFNEPAEYLENWKTAFWGNGNNYEKLLTIKKKYDPCSFFTCHNCVGFDLEGADNANDENQVCAGTRTMGGVLVIFLLQMVWNTITL